VIGVAFTADDAAPVPAEFVAVTVKEYVVPFESPDTMIGLAVPVPLNVFVPSLATAEYEVTALPPSEEGCEKVTVACPSPAETATSCGAEGGLSGEPDAVAAGPVPAEFVAVTAKVYTVPGASPVIVAVLAAAGNIEVPLALAGVMVTV